jgi:HYR domain
MTNRFAHPRTAFRPHAAQLWLAACAALAAAALVPFASASAAGTLTLKAEADIFYPPTSCPAAAPEGVACFTRTGVSLVRGLGKVEESYAYVLDERPAGCPEEHVRGLPSTARLTVPGKGAIDVRVSGTDCLARIPPAPVTGTETFTVTGGSGTYAGASGSGTIAHISNGPPAWRGQDTWTGTLVVPGLEFDLTPPVIRGAVAKRARAPLKARSVRVRFNVTATDQVDKSAALACTPKSGSRFRIGRTTVRCSAIDSSANRTTARFTITVVAARKLG